MGIVVEEGAARCPRCMAVAQYRFYEDDENFRYEVSCPPCGNVYSEVSLAQLADSPAA